MMKNLGILIAACLLFAGCKPAAAPSAEQIGAALTKVLKKDAPGATAKVTKAQPTEKDAGVISVDFTCTNCPDAGGHTALPSGHGDAAVALEVRTNKWVLLSVTACPPDDDVNCKFYHVHEYF